MKETLMNKTQILNFGVTMDVWGQRMSSENQFEILTQTNTIYIFNYPVLTKSVMKNHFLHCIIYTFWT